MSGPFGYLNGCLHLYAFNISDDIFISLYVFGDIFISLYTSDDIFISLYAFGDIFISLYTSSLYAFDGLDMWFPSLSSPNNTFQCIMNFDHSSVFESESVVYA